MKLLNIFKRKKAKEFKIIDLPEGYKAIPAFILDGVQYYQFEDAMKIPAGRAMATITFYTELEMRADRDYLEKHIRATEIILNGGATGKKIDLVALATINANLKERLDLVPFPDYIYKIASVMFFDGNERPFIYDQKYNDKKIAKWKETDGVLDFFLSKPLKNLIPYSESAGLSAQNYSELAEKVNQLHQKLLRELSSSPQ